MSLLFNLIEIFSVLIFFLLLGIRLYLKKREVKFEKFIVFEYSRKYTKKINEIVELHPRIFKIAGTLALLSAPFLTSIGIYYLLTSIILFKPTVALVLPSVSGIKYPGPVISVPFWIWILAIFVIVFSHESMHALIASSEGVKTKKYGLLYLIVIPIGAFVDVEEKKLKEINIIKKVKIFAAGSFGNLLVFILSLIILIAHSNLVNFFLESKGVFFNKTAPDSPAEKVGLKGIIIKIENQSISNIYDLQKFLANTKPNTSVIIETTEGKYNLTLAEKDNNPYIGIIGVKNYIVFKGSNKVAPEWLIVLIGYVFVILQWVSFLSLGVAVANMLPIVPLDGGLILKEVLKNKFGKQGEAISSIISSAFLIILISSLLLSSLTLRGAS